MKIAYLSPTNVQIRLDRGEEVGALDSLLPAFGSEVTVEIIIAAADPPPASASRLTAEEEAVAPGDTLPLFVKDDDGMTAAPGPDPAPALPVVQALKAKKRPSEVYVTDIESQVIRLLRQHPEGLTSPQIAKLLDTTVSKASVTVWRLRAERPTKDTTTPLVTKVTDGRHLVTALGKGLRLIVVKRPNYDNAKLGW